MCTGVLHGVRFFTEKSEGVYNGIERAIPPSTCQTFSITRGTMACQCQTFDNSVKHLTPGCCKCATCVTFVQHVCVSLYLFLCYTYYMRNNFKQYQTFFSIFSTTYHFYLFFLHFVVAIHFAICLTLIIERATVLAHIR